MAITVYSESWCTNFKNEGKGLSQRIYKKCKLNNSPSKKKTHWMCVYVLGNKKKWNDYKIAQIEGQIR